MAAGIALVDEVGRLTGSFATPDGRSYQLVHAQVHGVLERDGELAVSEAITFRFNGSFSGAYRDIPLDAGEEVVDVSVAEGATAYEPGGATGIGSFDFPGRFGAVLTAHDGKRFARIVWHYQSVNEQRTFTVRYRMRGLVQRLRRRRRRLLEGLGRRVEGIARPPRCLAQLQRRR